jgi:hypothetical protein
MRRLYCSFLAAAVMATVALGGAERASGAIRISISDGTAEKWYYSEDSNVAIFSTSLGTFDLMAHTVSTNFPGISSEGSLSTLLVLTDNNPTGSVLPTLTITADVIESLGLTTGFVTEASVSGAILSTFTSPSGSSLQISSDVGSMVTSGGTVQNTTTVGSTVLQSEKVALDADTDAKTTIELDATAGYTLSSQVVFEGGTPGIQNLIITSTSSVTNLTPEPASMVVWGLGAAGLAFAAARRRLGRASA